MVLSLPPVDGVKLTLAETSWSEYSIASIFNLTSYQKIMVLPTPGLILNSQKLDTVLAFSELDQLSTYPPIEMQKMMASVLVFRPSSESFHRLASAQTNRALPDLKLLQKHFASSGTLLSQADSDLDSSAYTTLGELRAANPTGERFNGTRFLASTAFVQLSDPQLPGIQFEVPYEKIVKLRPKDDDQSYLWEKMQNLYKDRRYGVCGLDLETWPEKTWKGKPEGRKDDL